MKRRRTILWIVICCFLFLPMISMGQSNLEVYPRFASQKSLLFFSYQRVDKEIYSFSKNNSFTFSEMTPQNFEIPEMMISEDDFGASSWNRRERFFAFFDNEKNYQRISSLDWGGAALLFLQVFSGYFPFSEEMALIISLEAMSPKFSNIPVGGMMILLWRYS